MLDFLRGELLRSQAPVYADVLLFLETAMGLVLLIGAVLARRGHFRAHACCQSSVVLLNTIVVAVVMVPSFTQHVAPKVPAKLGKPYYAWSTVHAVMGSVAEVVGLYILLAAGTGVLPTRFRLTKYKVWMRTALVLWWVVILLGWMTYFRWYMPSPGTKPANTIRRPT